MLQRAAAQGVAARAGLVALAPVARFLTQGAPAVITRLRTKPEAVALLARTATAVRVQVQRALVQPVRLMVQGMGPAVVAAAQGAGLAGMVVAEAEAGLEQEAAPSIRLLPAFLKQTAD